MDKTHENNQGSDDEIREVANGMPSSPQICLSVSSGVLEVLTPEGPQA